MAVSRLRFIVPTDTGASALGVYAPDNLRKRHALDYVSKTANYTVADGDHIVLVDATAGAVTITLQAASVGMPVVVVKTDSSGNAVSVARAGSDTINWPSNVAQTSYSITGQAQLAEFIPDGTSKYYLGRKT